MPDLAPTFSDRPGTAFWSVPDSAAAVDNPLTCARKLCAALRSLREQHDLTQADLAAEMDWSISKVLRMEAGTTAVGRAAILAFATFYGLGDENRRELAEWATTAKRARWWWHHVAGDLDDGVSDFLAHESSALAIQEYHSTHIPVLLRSPAYQRYMTAFPARGENWLPLRDPRSEQATTVTDTLFTGRRHVVEQGSARVRITLAESVLWRPMGEDLDVHVEQLDLLCAAAEQGRVELGVVPFNAGAHWGMAYSMIKMFGLAPVAPDASELDLVRCDYEPFGHPRVSTAPEWVEKGRVALDQIHTVTLPRADSLRMIRRIRTHVAAGTGYLEAKRAASSA